MHEKGPCFRREHNSQLASWLAKVVTSDQPASWLAKKRQQAAALQSCATCPGQGHGDYQRGPVTAELKPCPATASKRGAKSGSAIRKGDFMKRDSALILATSLVLLFVVSCQKPTQKTAIKVDGSGKGRVFEGIGGVSAGASSRLLIDYPEPQRSQILDYLFKPNYGASLQHLKVEVGGDTNSTDGSEPSHMRTRTDENYDRGYEWWLMKEAKARNPKIILDALPWGAPGWIGNGKYYSQDMANYIVKFIQGAKRQQGLDIDYVGIWNETDYDVGYIKLLKKTLLANGLTTNVVAPDLYENQWKIVDDFKRDPELKRDVYAVSVHYSRVKGNFYVTGSALESGKPLWSSEDQPFDETGIILQRDWKPGARLWAKILNTNYIDGKVTKTETWSPVTSYYDNLAAANSGLMYANTPWSGYYNVQSAVWVTAHTTQFAQPGWQYLDNACGYLKGRGSYVTLKAPTSSDYSVIVETIDATEPQDVEFQVFGGLSAGTIHVWETTTAKSFEKVSDRTPQNGSFRITLDPDAIYSLTTTVGQDKGTVAPPPPAPFPFPYADDFESATVGKAPKYLADQEGAFEAAACTGRPGQCLRQVIDKRSIPWGSMRPDPFTFLGSADWSDYEVSTDGMIEEPGNVSLAGRIDSADWFQDDKARWISGYVLSVQHDGTWELNSTKFKTPPSKLASGKVPVQLKTWHHLALAFKGASVQVSIDGASVANVTDTSHTKGMAGIGTGWNTAQFDNFAIK
jgi:O-glycosyl hydrolase